MEFYDSPEAEEESKSLSNKIDAVLDFFKDKSPEELQSIIKLLADSIELLSKTVHNLKEKAKYEALDKEELKLLRRLKKESKEISQKLEDTMLIMNHYRVMKANEYMCQLKLEATNGNSEAKKIYDKLLPSYKAALEEQASDTDLLN